MLHQETVDPSTLELIRRICNDPLFNNFHLVGGTALSLQLGHRKSVDIDLFCHQPFDAKVIADHLEKQYDATIDRHLSNGVWCYIKDVKTDIMSHQYPWLEAPLHLDGVRMVSLRDIAAMKMNVIHGKGTREKDFADIYTLLEHLPLATILESYQQKYGDVHLDMARYSLLYRKDIKKDSIEYTIRPVSSREMTRRFKQAVLHPNTIFQSPPPSLLTRKARSSRKGPGL